MEEILIEQFSGKAITEKYISYDERSIAFISVMIENGLEKVTYYHEYSVAIMPHNSLMVDEYFIHSLHGGPFGALRRGR